MSVERLSDERLVELPKTAVTIRRRTFRLTVHSIETMGAAPDPIFSCRVSIGAFGFETPKGRFWILEKQSPPTWTKPLSDWVPEDERGEVVPADDPANPLKGAWLRLTWDGIGIHGSDSWPLGQKASHGCIRVTPENAVKLFDLVDLGSPVAVL